MTAGCLLPGLGKVPSGKLLAGCGTDQSQARKSTFKPALQRCRGSAADFNDLGEVYGISDLVLSRNLCTRGSVQCIHSVLPPFT